MLRLARIFAEGEPCQEPLLLALLVKLRAKSNCKRNEFAFRMLNVLHMFVEFSNKRQRLFEAIVQPGRNWWNDHKAERARLRDQYGQ